MKTAVKVVVGLLAMQRAAGLHMSQSEEKKMAAITVATLNSLAPSKTSRSLASFPMVPDETISMKKGAEPWLAGILDALYAKGTDIVALQEVEEDHALKSGFNCKLQWKYGKEADADHQHLCFREEKLVLAGDCALEAATAGFSQRMGKGIQLVPAGYKICSFRFRAPSLYSKGFTVMAAHASPNFADIVKKIPFGSAAGPAPPDVILMDANQKGGPALEAANSLGLEYKRFPAGDEVTTVKSAFFLRKLSQAYEGTVKVPRKPKEGEPPFYGMDDDTTCEELLETCAAASKATLKADKSLGNNCKYGKRVCMHPPPDFKYRSEMAKLMCASMGADGVPTVKNCPDASTDKKYKPTEEFLSWQKSFKVRSLQAQMDAVFNSGLSQVAMTLTKAEQEDMILYNVAKFALADDSTVIYPDFASDDEWKALGATTGYPNSYWPSDHVLVGATLVGAPVSLPKL